MKTKTILNWSPYNVNVYIYLGTDYNLVNEKHGLSLIDDQEGEAIKISSYHYVLFFNKSDNLRISLVAHEMVHLMDLIISSFEMEISLTGNTELRARLTEDLIQRISKAFKSDLVIG